MTEKQVQLLGFQKEILFGYDDEENDGAYYYALEDIYLRPLNNGLLSPTGGENSEKVDGTWYNRKRQSVENKKQFYE